jgi:hypothetical protein
MSQIPPAHGSHWEIEPSRRCGGSFLVQQTLNPAVRTYRVQVSRQGRDEEVRASKVEIQGHRLVTDFKGQQFIQHGVGQAALT